MAGKAERVCVFRGGPNQTPVETYVSDRQLDKNSVKALRSVNLFMLTFTKLLECTHKHGRFG